MFDVHIGLVGCCWSYIPHPVDLEVRQTGADCEFTEYSFCSGQMADTPVVLLLANMKNSALHPVALAICSGQKLRIKVGTDCVACPSSSARFKGLFKAHIEINRIQLALSDCCP